MSAAIVQDVVTRLSVLGVPVLPPERATEPAGYAETDAQGRPKVGGERGLHLYLAQQAAGGYVQVETPLAISTDGQADVFWTAVAVLATSATTCGLVAARLRLLLAGTTRDPAPYDLVTPDQPSQIQPGVWLCRPTFGTTLLNGQMPQE